MDDSPLSRWNERVIAQLYSPQNKVYLKSVISQKKNIYEEHSEKRNISAISDYELIALLDIFTSYRGEARRLLQSDPFMQRSKYSNSVDYFWHEVRRLNKAFLESYARQKSEEYQLKLHGGNEYGSEPYHIQRLHDEIQFWSSIPYESELSSSELFFGTNELEQSNTPLWQRTNHGPLDYDTNQNIGSGQTGELINPNRGWKKFLNELK